MKVLVTGGSGFIGSHIIDELIYRGFDVVNVDDCSANNEKFYFNNKAKNLYFLSKILLEKHKSRVPNNLEDLILLPGVGRKTANVVLNEVFNKPTIAVDTHVFRVGNRTGLCNGKNPEQVENQLLKILPKKYIKKAHHLILLHGRYTCKARNPLCKTCVINKICLYKGKNE